MICMVSESSKPPSHEVVIKGPGTNIRKENPFDVFFRQYNDNPADRSAENFYS
jgi:hypothetical protein